MVFEAVQILVALATNLAAVRLLLFHSDSAGVGNGCGGIYDGESAVGVLLELLVLMTMLRAG